MVSTKPDSFSVSVWIATCTSILSATLRAASIAAGVVPQSSCSFRPIAPASTCSTSGGVRLALPLPRKPRFIGKASAASSIRWMCHGPGVHVVANVPVAGPVPPPSIVVTPDISASSICCGQMKWMCESMPPAVTIMPSPAMISVPAPITMSTPGWMSGLPRLAELRDLPVLDGEVALDDAPPVDHQRVGDDGVRRILRLALALAHAVADHLAAAELDLFAIDREVALDLDEEIGVGEPDAVADRGPEHLGVRATRDLHRAAPALSGGGGTTRRRALPVERAHHGAREAVHDAIAGERDELDHPLLTGLEADRRTGGDVQPEAPRRGAIERESAVRFGEVIVRAHLDRPVARVGDFERDRRAARVELELAFAGNDLAGDHGIGW